MVDTFIQPKCHVEADWKLVTRPNDDKIFVTCEKCGKQAFYIDAWVANHEETFFTDTCGCGNVALFSKCCMSSFDIVQIGERYFLQCNECEEIVKGVEVSNYK